jgi:hypothetical protein
MSHRFAKRLLYLLVLLLLIGTQMPGAWRSGIEADLHAPLGLSSWAHFALFAAMATVALMPPLAWPRHQVGFAALALALITEGMQFLAIDRHPRWLDISIDMAGAMCAMVLVIGVIKYRKKNSVSD